MTGDENNREKVRMLGRFKTFSCGVIGSIFRRLFCRTPVSSFPAAVTAEAWNSRSEICPFDLLR